MASKSPKINLSSPFKQIQNYYDNNLNVDPTLVETSNDEPTPITCVQEMVSKIPEEFWKNPNLKILDPCCGCGNFPMVIYFQLLKYHDSKHILQNMLYMNDINENRLNKLRDIFGEDATNISKQDFLTFDADIDFDMIVANPPYAKLLPSGKRASKNHNLIGLFINKSLSILRKSGFILYITPDNWMSYADRNTLILKLTEMQIHHINIHTAKKYFKKIGSSFTWYLIENTPAYKDITIDGIWKKNTYSSKVKSQIRRYIPLFYNRIIQSILNKTIDVANEKYKVETSSDLHKYTKKKLISKTKTDEFKYKLIHTPKQTVWSSRPHKFQAGYKVFISTTSYYGTFVDNCGMTQSIAFIRCKSKKDAEKTSKILNHPLYIFINNICRYGNFNNVRILQRFPKCDKKENVYSKFKLTDEEIQFVQAHV